MSVSAPAVEQEFAERVLGCVALDDCWKDAVLKALASEGPKPDHSLEIKRVEGALANLRKQHLWGMIGDDEFKSEHQELRRQFQQMERSAPPSVSPNMDRAAQLLQDLPALWQHPGVTPGQRRDLAREVFHEIRLRDGELVSVEPQPQYQPIFAYCLWRQDVAGDHCST